MFIMLEVNNQTNPLALRINCFDYINPRKMFKLTVLYPKTSEDNFDLDYYINSHTVLVKRLLEPEGLVKVEIEEGMAGGAPGSDAAYTIICGLFFPDPETLEKALEKHGFECISDISNFTSVVPLMQVSRVLE